MTKKKAKKRGAHDTVGEVNGYKSVSGKGINLVLQREEKGGSGHIRRSYVDVGSGV